MSSVFRLGTSNEVLEAKEKHSAFFGNAFLPQKANIPIGYASQKDIFILVSKGMKVREGQLLSRADASSPFSYVHSSIPGVVTDFKEFEIMPGKVLKTVEVALEGSFELLGRLNKENDWHVFSSTELFDKIEKSGVLNTSSRILHSLSFEIKRAMNKGITSLSTTFFDFYPTQALDIFLSDLYIKKLIEGTLILAHTLGANTITFFHNIKKKNLLLEYENLIKELCGNVPFELKKIKPCYPLHLQLGNTFFVDASTALYAYEAIVNEYPLTSIYLTIQGNVLSESKIFHAKIGTPIGSLIEECGGIKEMPEGLIINGLTHGYAVKNLDLPLSKDMKSIHVVSKEMLNFYDKMDCINCGRCFQACPCCIDPISVVRAINKNAVCEEVIASIKRCEACACCSIVCPSRINLSQAIISYKDEHFPES